MTTITSASYARRKSRALTRGRAETLLGQDIAPLPSVKHPDRRARADSDFKFFCETYFPRKFYLPWSPDHLKVIAKVERSVIHGERFAVAMPRGSGKTALCNAAVLWALLGGHHAFVYFVRATKDDALLSLESIKASLSNNAELLADYPEACYPCRCLEQEARRAKGQRYHGVQTNIRWESDEIVLATLPESRCSGGIIRVAGLHSHLRGAFFERPDGMMVRPSLLVLDDPQTDESARSLSQTGVRVSMIHGAVSGLAGPDKSIAALMPCTVIQAGDLADQFLDVKKNPAWQGERTKLLYEFPKRMDLWERYWQVYSDDRAAGGTGSLAMDFYQTHRTEMDKGARVAWPERFSEKEVSALQFCMDLFFRDKRSFAAEYQNDPIPDIDPSQEEGLLTMDEIARKLNGHQRGSVPIGASHLTAFVDIQQRVLFWIVCAWHDDFTGYVVDYGAYPDQARDRFTAADARPTLQQMAPKAGLEGSIYAGLDALVGNLLAREWRREDGAMLRVGLCLVDANWGTSTDVVYQFCRQNPHSAVLLPSHGRFVGASSRPFHEYEKRPGDRVGLNWRQPRMAGKRAIRHVVFDTNFWKSFVHSRLAVAMGDPGCLSLYGRDPQARAMLAEHLTAEYRIKTFGRGRVVDEWKPKPGQTENHWLDGLVGCAVAASILGAERPEMSGGPARSSASCTIRMSDLQRQRRDARRQEQER